MKQVYSMNYTLVSLVNGLACEQVICCTVDVT